MSEQFDYAAVRSDLTTRVVSMSNEDALAILKGYDDETAMQNRKLFESSYVIRCRMGAAVYALYRTAGVKANAGSDAILASTAVSVGMALTAHLDGFGITKDRSRQSYDDAAKAKLFGLSWDTLYDNYDLFRFGTPELIREWLDHEAKAKGLSPNSTKAFIVFARKANADGTSIVRTPQSKGAATKASIAAEMTRQAEAKVAAAKAISDAAAKAKADEETKRVDRERSAASMADGNALIGGLNLTYGQVRSLGSAAVRELAQLLKDIAAAIDTAAVADAAAKAKADAEAAAKVTAEAKAEAEGEAAPKAKRTRKLAAVS
jgi:hypothetical protein